MRGKDFALGAIVGGITAGIAVALTTPKNGPEMRKDIKDQATKVYEEGMEATQDIRKKGAEKFNEAKDVVVEKSKTLKEEASKIKVGKKKDMKVEDFELNTSEIDAKLEELKDEVLKG